MPEELKQAYQELIDKYNAYKDKYASWLKETKGKIFKLKELPSFHTNNPFEGDSFTRYFGGIVRFLVRIKVNLLLDLCIWMCVHDKIISGQIRKC